MNQKGFMDIALVVVIVAIIAVGGYFIFVKKSEPISQQPTPTPTSTQTKTPVSPTPIPTPKNETANWVEYSNIKYNYQIKYPEDWTIEADGIAVWQNQVPSPELANGVVFFGTKTEPYGQTARALWNIRVFVSPAENPKKLSPRDWYVEQSKFHFSYGVEQKFDNLEDTTFKGLPALKVKGNSGEGYSFLIAKSSTIYNLSFSFEKFSGGEFPVPPEEIFLEMLDSFILD